MKLLVRSLQRALRGMAPSASASATVVSLVLHTAPMASPAHLVRLASTVSCTICYSFMDVYSEAAMIHEKTAYQARPEAAGWPAVAEVACKTGTSVASS